MVLESTMLCVDNSDYMRNGDFIPTRLQAEQDAVNMICQCKLRLHPENNVGLLTMGEQVQVLATLTQDTSRIFTKMHQVQPQGNCKFLAGIRVAHLALKHRQGRNHKTRIVLFVGSPIDIEQGELIKLAKRLKKEKVNVDVINFGESEGNVEKLQAFIETLNGREGTGSHLVTIPPGSALSEALLSSPVLRGEDGAAPLVAAPGAGGGMDFGIDPNEDPELALALRVSMEEQRARQEAEARQATETSASEAAAAAAAAGAAPAAAAPVPMEESAPAAAAAAAQGGPNLDAMTEEEQIEMALQMSLQAEQAEAEAAAQMETDAGASAASAVATAGEHKVGSSVDPKTPEAADQAELADLLQDPKALEDLVKTLPGVDPKSKEVQETLASLQKEKKKDDSEKK